MHDRMKKNVPWHILAPSAVACDMFLLRASAHHWHVSAFLCNREFQGISYYTKRQFPAFARELPPISLTAIFKIVPTAFCKTNTDFLQIYLQISDPNSDFVRFPLIQFRPVFITSPRKIIPHRSPRCQFPRFQTFPPIHLQRSDLKMPEASVQDGYY